MYFKIILQEPCVQNAKALSDTLPGNLSQCSANEQASRRWVLAPFRMQ